ncbi:MULTISPECIES: formate-dependent phosphoribosylglycinamide formyltransferase [Leptospira]|uniref:Formate-dependent phosphoribosylglycinamide formyltransferase n=3 Tax=Leptospira weilii TaxID=28184 RepID=A0A828Z0I1_9LEPT|nr:MULTISPECIES: formate-dependent phosphoribosylglycinamide formyltransferase [Leptospira]EMM74709.1 phosphoribosylglycinamide formyltransferase 2 [Leptospira weilii str. 2006001855]EKR64430.1 phosphoribosylglycinamide formyltransferase 2 [Leptospira weilii str. 2006001853]EMJ66944.1 phosphoribosylglycinamide formyltransferase 2 [Leptospira sp. P2653]EMN45767.1 phosphoribosylglycinamide formyltransferase 2 [Leptospira weilii str. LNT 1234]MCL8265248.1 formate-dependent phosphoribosylglycinami
MKKKILLLGSGELGKEFVIAAQRLGQYVIAVDSYDNAPAMQVAHEKEIINMLDGNLLDQVVEKHKPDLIVPEIEAIKTERFYEYEKQGYQIVPSAKAANFTMNRKSIRDLAAKDLKLPTAKYLYASSEEELIKATEILGFPCVVKPLMSSSGKGQSVIKSPKDISKAWEASQTKGRTGTTEIIVEEFISFKSEITLLTVTQKNGKTLFCPPIGHRQERGDYQESWQPAEISEAQLKEAQKMAGAVTKELTGFGIWGVEFFLTEDQVYFSELSPRPHDTGMVTLAGTQNFNEFELHIRAILGIPISEITQERKGASAVILASTDGKIPETKGLDIASEMPESDFRIFGKPITRPYRRMGVALSYSSKGEGTSSLRKRAILLASKIKVD